MLELSDDALLDTIYSSVEPNPDRVGCPSREVLRELAMRTRPLSNAIWDHVMECAPCRIDVREMDGSVLPGMSAQRRAQSASRLPQSSSPRLASALGSSAATGERPHQSRVSFDRTPRCALISSSRAAPRSTYHGSKSD
jgi:hypothetical protein